MLFLLFHLGADRYMLEARQVAEVLPLIDIMQVPLAPPEIAGVFNYRGALVPAIDLAQVALGRAAHRRLHTRIVVVHYTDDSGATKLLGLIVEKVTETLQRDVAGFVVSGITTPHLGHVATDRQGLIHKVEVNQLLPASMRSLLFQQPMPH